MKNLLWSNHLEAIEDILQDLYDKKYMSDVTLICDDYKHVKAHKIILSSFSTVFHNIFFLDKNASVLYLRGVDSRDLIYFILFYLFIYYNQNDILKIY